MKKSRWWIATVPLAVVTLGIVSTWLFLAHTQGGVAIATLELHAAHPDFDRLEIRSAPLSEEDRRRLDPLVPGKVKHLTSEPVMRALLDSDSVRSTDWYAQFGGNDDAALAVLKSEVIVATHIPDSGQVRLQVVTENRADALCILNQWIEVERERSGQRLQDYFMLPFYRNLEQERLGLAGKIESVRAASYTTQEAPPESSSHEQQLIAVNLMQLESRKDNVVHTMRELRLVRWRDQFCFELLEGPTLAGE